MTAATDQLEGVQNVPPHILIPSAKPQQVIDMLTEELQAGAPFGYLAADLGTPAADV
ncbi:hypothetical protein [Nonomuraea basaltis]|uniref:hypothetical protein n=1 Tax=Nonomuraea basaltis TaxID=2495887 RepID=UPI0014864FCD|nr:hypothetical protein [Nonomuraea basaltis]